MTIYQQGDVLLDVMEGTVLPEGKEILPREGRFILAEGETTGHAHALEAAKGITMIEDPQGNVYLKLVRQEVLKHEEHGRITLPPGVYKVRKVQEYDHAAEEARNVAD